MKIWMHEDQGGKEDKEE
ncbi:uncharacterized protein FFFS_16025 [Fusarium fujikuroi]|nr:uncharacterized protein FFFS_16025 [Fusarium fujikuroi]